MRSILFCKKAEFVSIDECRTGQYDIRCFEPRIIRPFIEGERLQPRGKLVRLYFCLIARGEMKIFYCKSESGAIIHTSCVLPRCFKFPYLEKGAITVGPCNTHLEFRGKGIYPMILNHILSEEHYRGKNVYMVVNETNTSSIKGVVRAGFKPCGYIRKSKLLKRYFREVE